MNEMGRFRERRAPDHARPRRATCSCYERDVSELAQAKGANAAGLRVVFETLGVEAGDIDVFYLAGGVRPPPAGGGGAAHRAHPDDAGVAGRAVRQRRHRRGSIALLSRSKRRELESLVSTVEHCRLETHPHFFDYFVEGCQFKPLEFTGRVAG